MCKKEADIKTNQFGAEKRFSHLLKSQEKSIVCVCNVPGESMALSQTKLLRNQAIFAQLYKER